MLSALPGYFGKHRQWLSALFGDVDPPERLIEEGRLQVIMRSAEDTGIGAGSVDLVLSNSVLEHVRDLGALFAELDRVVKPNARQYHFVDLTDHQAGADPFRRLCEHEPGGLRRLNRPRGLHVNMLRSVEIERLMSERFDVKRTVLLSNPHAPTVRSPHPYWRERFSTDELSIEVVAFELVGRGEPQPSGRVEQV